MAKRCGAKLGPIYGIKMTELQVAGHEFESQLNHIGFNPAQILLFNTWLAPGKAYGASHTGCPKGTALMIMATR